MIELGEHKQSIHGVVRMNHLDKQDEMIAKGFSKVILSHFGEFSIDFISDISERIEAYMVSAGDSKHVIKRMFTILIEGMKNIRQHGLRDERSRQLGYLLIGQSDDTYILSVANLVDKDDIESLGVYLDKINHYDESELREKYDEALDREFLNLDGSGGLGMIVTRLKTGNKLLLEEFEVGPNMLLCSFSVELNRS